MSLKFSIQKQLLFLTMAKISYSRLQRKKEMPQGNCKIISLNCPLIYKHFSTLNLIQVCRYRGHAWCDSPSKIISLQKQGVFCHLGVLVSKFSNVRKCRMVQPPFRNGSWIHLFSTIANNGPDPTNFSVKLLR